MNFQEIYDMAHKAGMDAGNGTTPAPMIVSGGVLGEAPKHYYEPEGLCGFGWIEFAGNTAWGRWCKSNGIADKHYPKGLSIWVRGFGQSYERKVAYARAFAQVLRNNGIDAYGTGRLD